jgi:polyisoprenyl-phosphate glycosyltransferase
VFEDVPAFLELRRRLAEVLASDGGVPTGAHRFVVVDDTAGMDPEVDQLQDLADVRVLETPFNLGHQRAIVYGLRRVSDEIRDEDIVVTLDADGEDRPEDLLRLLAPLMDAPAPQRLVLARRTRRRTSLRFKMMYLVFRVLFRLLTGTSVRTGNYAAYRGSLAKRMLLHPHFDLCYSSSLLTLNRDIEFVPCERGERYSGRSKMGFSRLFLHGLRMMMPFADRVAMRALILFTVTFSLGVLLSLTVLAVRAFTDSAIPGWATSAIIGTLLLSFIALGNFITLFAVFSQSMGISLSGIDRARRGSA